MIAGIRRGTYMLRREIQRRRVATYARQEDNCIVKIRVKKQEQKREWRISRLIKNSEQNRGIQSSLKRSVWVLPR